MEQQDIKRSDVRSFYLTLKKFLADLVEKLTEKKLQNNCMYYEIKELCFMIYSKRSTYIYL